MLSLDEWIALLETGKATVEAQVIVTSCVVAVALIVTFVYENWLRKVIEKIIWRSRNTWDDYVFSDKLMRSLGYFIPLVIIYEALPYSLVKGTFVYVVCYRVLLASLIAMVAHCLGLIISGVNDKIQASDATNRPTSGVFQMIKIIVWCFAAILIIAALADKNPGTLITGLTAFAAVLSLVFKDTIMGLVAGVQLAAYDMIHVGDWIAVDKYGIDGVVEEVTLNIVKVRNWDNTITTIPTWSLVSDSFKNWSGMSASGGRRIKRSISIDVTSIRFLDEDEMQRLNKAHLLKPYLTSRHQEINEWNRQQGSTESILNLRRMTNIGTFRAYLNEYLRNHPRIRKDMTLMVRQLAPGDNGLPLEIYAFTNTVVWLEYESIQADIFDHIFAIVEEFGLRLHQSPTGNDIRSLAGAFKQ